MPKITIKYEHPHELTELFSKLAQMYVLPESTCCADEPNDFNNTVDEMQNDRIADLINQNRKLDEYRETLKQIHNLIIERGLLSDVSFEDGIKHFPLLISCIFKDNKDMRNSLRELGVHVSTKDNSPFIADSDNQLFTLEEAAKYLEVGINEMPLVMANYLPSMGKLTTKKFLLSDLRWIKANLKLSSTRFGEVKAQIRRT